VPAAPDPVIPAAVLAELGQGGDLLGTWWPAAAAAALTAALVVVAVRRRRRARRDIGARTRTRTWPWWTGAGVAGLLAAALVANVVSGYAPDVAALRTVASEWGIGHVHALAHGTAVAVAASATTGAQTQVQIGAPAALRMSGDPAWVYTPPGYDEGDARYPVVLLIHGTPGHSGDWFAAGRAGHTMDVLLAHHLLQPMIVVSVDVNGSGPGGSDTECLDSTTGGAQVETYLTTVVVPWVDDHYRTSGTRAGRALGGFSSGAYCTLDQGLRHADLFSTMLALEPYVTPGAAARTALSTDAQRAAHDVAATSATADLPDGTALFVGLAGVGGADHATSRAVAATLSGRGVDVVVHTDRGTAHTWTMARDTLPYALVFASAQLST
jgi:enterochelin esterase-like enzyme